MEKKKMQIGIIGSQEIISALMAKNKEMGEPLIIVDTMPALDIANNHVRPVGEPIIILDTMPPVSKNEYNKKPELVKRINVDLPRLEIKLCDVPKGCKLETGQFKIVKNNFEVNITADFTYQNEKTRGKHFKKLSIQLINYVTHTAPLEIVKHAGINSRIKVKQIQKK